VAGAAPTTERYVKNGLVFASRGGTELNPGNIRRGFRRVVENAGLNPGDWTPREPRHSFVSLLSDSGAPVERSRFWSA
jgi:site-specific recombinase XerD